MNKRQIGVYWESWVVDSLDNLKSHFNTVYLAFATPECNYQRWSRTFEGTGLNFNIPFEEVVESIKRLQARNIKVFLAVGGASYWSIPRVFYPQRIVDLMIDLGVDGIDFDWEVGVKDCEASTHAIKDFRRVAPKTLVSYTCFSTGAFQTQLGDNYKGMNRHTLHECGYMIDFVNVMAYDAGKDFDEQEAHKAYRKLYKGPINLGFQVGKQGWGYATLRETELRQNLNFIKNQNSFDGCFLWAYHKPAASPQITVQQFGSVAKRMLKERPETIITKCPACCNPLEFKIFSSEPKKVCDLEVEHPPVDLKFWGLTLPIKREDRSDAKIINFPEDFDDLEYFKRTPTGSILFICPAGGATTKNSKYPRSELREYDQDDGTKADWSAFDEINELTCTLAIHEIPLVKPEVTVCQIHDGNSDVMQLNLKKSRLYVRGSVGSKTKDYGTLDDKYDLGTKFRVKIVCMGGRIKVYYNNYTTPKLNFKYVGDDYNYFKVGCYMQSNTSKGEDPDTLAKVELYALDVKHRGVH